MNRFFYTVDNERNLMLAYIKSLGGDDAETLLALYFYFFFWIEGLFAYFEYFFGQTAIVAQIINAIFEAYHTWLVCKIGNSKRKF